MLTGKDETGIMHYCDNIIISNNIIITRDKQMGLPLRGRPVLLSLV